MPQRILLKLNMYNESLILPPEWAEQSAIQLTWPHVNTDWNYCLDDILHTYECMADAITRHERLIVVAPDTVCVKQQLEKRLSKTQMSNIIFHRCETNDTWARDHAFITLIGKDATSTLLDFCFNGWGEKFRADKDNAINRSLYNSGVLKGNYADLNDFVLEGGSIETDGHGTIFTTSSCLLAPHRNQPMTREDIEDRLLSCLHGQRLIWIEHGHLEGDDTDGHIDTLVRTAPDYTLLYIGCDDKNDVHYEELKEMERQLQSLRTPEGDAYRLIKLPMPDAIYEDGERLPATYANFVIINGAVIYPTYNQPDKDEQAKRAIKAAFPDREMIGIDSCTVVRQHGSLHCCTMQYPQKVDICNNKS